MPLSVGEALGPYEIVALVGKGGMGEVYRAHDSRLNRDVAIKVSNAQFTERFTREARTIASLNHTNICHLYDVGPNYLVMEYVEGPDLRGPLDFEDALPIIQQLIDGIEAAHEKNIIHRDLKPTNIKITREGVVKILDFGLAKAMEPPPSDDGKPENSPTLTMGATVEGTILGTAAYMAPEQAKGKSADRRSDIWSFGVIVYEMLTGKRLFQGDTAVEILGGVLNKDADISAAPPRVHKLLRWCLEKDRKKRLQAIGDARRLLEENELTTPAGAAPPRHRSWLPWCVAAFLLLALMPANILHFREQLPQEASLRFQIPLPEKVGGSAYQTISPDGRYLVFWVVNRGANEPLWVRPLNSLTAQPLAGTEGAYSPFWSPDSKSIGFFAEGKLKRIEINGGPALGLADATVGIGGAWVQDGNSGGVILFTPNVTGPILRVSAGGGTASPATKLRTGETYHHFPWFLPDGRHFLYVASVSEGARSAIHVGDLSSPEDRVLGEADSKAVYSQGFMLFLRQDTLMAQPFDAKRGAATGDAVPLEQQVTSQLSYADFSASNNGLLAFRTGASGGRVQLTWVDRNGRQLGPLGEPGVMRDFHFSPDRKRVAAGLNLGTANNFDIWIYDTAGGLRTRFTFDPAFDQNPVWSPDGRSIIFSSKRKQHFDLYRKSSDGAGADELLYSDDLDKLATDWSADGKFLSYRGIRGVGNVGNVWVLPLTPERQGAPLKPFPFAPSPFSEGNAHFSPDGHWVAYASDESKRLEVYVARFPGAGGKRQISVAGGLTPRWRQDGKEIFYMTPDGTIMAAAVTIKADALEVGEVRPLSGRVVTSGYAGNYHYDVSADGQRFLVALPEKQTSIAAVTVVQNWQAGLKK